MVKREGWGGFRREGTPPPPTHPPLPGSPGYHHHSMKTGKSKNRARKRRPPNKGTASPNPREESGIRGGPQQRAWASLGSTWGRQPELQQLPRLPGSATVAPLPWPKLCCPPVAAPRIAPPAWSGYRAERSPPASAYLPSMGIPGVHATPSQPGGGYVSPMFVIHSPKTFMREPVDFRRGSV